MYRVAIVEDERVCREQIHGFVERFSQEKNIPIKSWMYEDPQTFLAHVEDKQEKICFDIIFLDIDMPVINGMEVARIVRQFDEKVLIVFITNLKQYAIQGYSVGALDYVLKPIDYYSFSLRLARAIERVQKKQTVEILLSSGDKLVRLDSDDVYFIESVNRMLIFHTTKGKYEVRETMKAREEELSDYHFVKCNHWYLVNLKHVSAINQNIVTVGGFELEISRRNKSSFSKAVTDYVGGGF